MPADEASSGSDDTVERLLPTVSGGALGGSTKHVHVEDSLMCAICLVRIIRCNGGCYLSNHVFSAAPR